MEVLSVSQFVAAVNGLLDTLEGIVIEGEVAEFKVVHNKWVTFQLKDEESTIGCFLTVWQYRTPVEDGMLVRVTGRPNLRNKGFFSFVVTNIQPSGEGALKRAFELLRAKLAAEGLFSAERKRTLPRFPEHVALITSREAAAFSDFIKVLQARQGGLSISFLHTQVQGAEAPAQIIRALQYSNTHLDTLDAIVLVRGGGSLEDLQAFNDEAVVRAVAASRTPTVVGIGHERDITLAELAADVRASTPSNAAELLVRSREELALELLQLRQRARAAVDTALQAQHHRISRALSVLRGRVAVTRQRVSAQLTSLAGIRQRLRHAIATQRSVLTQLRTTTERRMHDTLAAAGERVTTSTRLLHSLSPTATLARGYSITRTTAGLLIRSVATLTTGDAIETQLTDGSFTATVAARKQTK